MTEQFYCDLHTHSVISDGALTPKELISAARTSGIRALAITDHDTYDEQLEQLKRETTDLTLITGGEFSAKYRTPAGNVITIHIIGLFFDPQNDKLKKIVQDSRKNQEAYIRAVLQKLEDAGMHITYEEVLADAPERKILGRLPIAKLMVKKGFPHCETSYGAMDYWIGGMGQKHAYVERNDYLDFPDMKELISVLCEAGAITVLCHPYYYHLGVDGLKQLIKEFKACAGEAAAMEVYYKDYSQEQTQTLERLAKAYGLLPSAGSDYHGQDENEYLMHCFPISIYEALYERKKQLSCTSNTQNGSSSAE